MQEPGWLANALEETVSRLGRLIRTPSFSREESAAALLFETWMKDDGIAFNRKGNNIWATNLHFDPGKPVMLLNSHIDTVKPAPGYTMDPFGARIDEGRLYGLGSNDAGGALLCLYTIFKRYHGHENLARNLVFAATAEEEISGMNGVESILDELGAIAFAIVGEPTCMNLAVAEKGLLVLDCISRGKAGHAARNEGVNAIYAALNDIEWFRTHRFERLSPSLGEVKMNVTMIEAGTQHNVVPGTCSFTVDIRCTDAYTHEELLAIIRQHVSCEVKPRSMRLKASSIAPDHDLVKAAARCGCQAFGSPTLSDQALMPFPSAKIGPGDSARSHQADEFILVEELEHGLKIYDKLVNQLITT